MTAADSRTAWTTARTRTVSPVELRRSGLTHSAKQAKAIRRIAREIV
ncbi:hypothetical protein ACTWQF_09730 [Streptomyces sp. 8N114]